MKKIVSVRLDEWLSDEVDRIAKALGITQSALIRQFVEQGINNQNALADYVTNEAERMEKLLKRIESVVFGHMHFSTVVATGADKSEFMKTMARGRKVVEQMNKLEQEGE